MFSSSYDSQLSYLLSSKCDVISLTTGLCSYLTKFDFSYDCVMDIDLSTWDSFVCSKI